MNRRDFSLALAGLPFIGTFFQKEKPKYKLKATWSSEPAENWLEIFNVLHSPYKDCEGYKFWMERDFITRERPNNAYSKWDFNDSLGDTIMEKYEALYLQVVYKIGYGHGWIVDPSSSLMSSNSTQQMFNQ